MGLTKAIRAVWLGITLGGASVLAAAGPVWAQTVSSNETPASASNATIAPVLEPEAEPPNDVVPSPSYAAPLVGIVSFDFLLNRTGEHLIDRDTYRITHSSVRRNLRRSWVVDSDPFSTNQFLHPYQGSVYHGFARSAGLNYWQSLGYTFAGSALWEIAGETKPPSINDQIASGIGGTFLGEPLFRIANLVLEESGHLPWYWRELLVTAISPSTEFNRVAYGDRFRRVFPSRAPVTYPRLQVGAMGTSSVRKDILQTFARNEGVMEFAIDYGLPGKPDYAYTRPFDYFSLEFAGSSANTFEHIFSRGLLAGRKHGDSARGHRGVWGLYGAYDYVSPQLFRMSSVAVSLGDTSERRLVKSIELHSTILGGVGYGAAGTIRGTDETDYHYGLTPQLLVATRFIAGDRTALDLTLRDYYVSRIASTQLRGSENNARAEALFTYRVWQHHGASAKYVWSRRAATYPDLGHRIQSRGSFGFFYTYLGDTRFGSVGW